MARPAGARLDGPAGRRLAKDVEVRQGLAVSGEPRFTRLARAAAVTLRAQLLHGGRLVAAPLGPEIDADTYSDVVAGAAGCLVPLLGLHARRPSGPGLALAVRCGERLLARARRMERGWGWILDMAGLEPLAGFSHGAAGISWALLQRAAATGDERFQQAALHALEYERSLYSPSNGWPDLRQGAPTEEHSMCAWCHGAPGIALGRLDSLRFLDGAPMREEMRYAMRDEIATAVDATLASGFGKGHSLCHGDLGNLEILAMAAAALDIPGLDGRLGRLAGEILGSIREYGWRCGVLTRGEMPGLMLGLAGIGYGLLRAGAPERVPSVLCLALPSR